MARDPSNQITLNRALGNVYDADGKFIYTYDSASEISRGIVTDRAGQFKYGHNTDVDTALETVWSGGGVYSDIPTATQLTISSSSNTDDIADTGARTVEIFGLDNNWSKISETVDLDGQTGTTTTETYLFIYRMIVRSAGSGGTAVGTIYAGTGSLTVGVPANIYAMIDIGYNQTMMTRYVTAADEEAALHSWFISVNGKKQIEGHLVFLPFGEVRQVKNEIYITIDGGSSGKDFHIPLYVPPKTIVEVRAKGAAVNNEVTANFELECIDV